MWLATGRLKSRDPIVVNVGGLQSQGAEGEVVVSYCDPSATPDLESSDVYNNRVDIGIALGPYRRAMDLTPQAKKMWDAIAPDQRLRILNNVWCVNCMKPSSMGSVRGHVDKGVLSLKGVCTRCNGLVAKIVEQPQSYR